MTESDWKMTVLLCEELDKLMCPDDIWSRNRWALTRKSFVINSVLDWLDERVRRRERE